MDTTNNQTQPVKNLLVQRAEAAERSGDASQFSDADLDASVIAEAAITHPWLVLKYAALAPPKTSNSPKM